LAVNSRMNRKVRSRYSTNCHEIVLDLIMIFITITTIIENTIFLLTALDAVTHLAEGLALARCRASDTERSVGARQLIAEVT